VFERERGKGIIEREEVKESKRKIMRVYVLNTLVFYYVYEHMSASMHFHVFVHLCLDDDNNDHVTQLNVP